MAQPRDGVVALELFGWKTALSWIFAVLLGLLFASSGIWKMAEPGAWAMRIAELKFPASLSVTAALAFGTAETTGALLILIPRFRRWGAILIGVLLIGFMGYFAWNYNALRGAECSCFPWIKRVVGPEFFFGDALMLALALAAGAWAKPARGLRQASALAAAVLICGFALYGVDVMRQTGTKGPETVAVNSRPYSVGRGKVFLFFFNPECSHCFESAKTMSRYHWGSTRVVAVPVEVPEYADSFLQETGLKAVVTTDFPSLKTTFGYTAYPFGVAVENGREKAPITRFEQDEPEATLKKMGFIE